MLHSIQTKTFGGKGLRIGGGGPAYLPWRGREKEKKKKESERKTRGGGLYFHGKGETRKEGLNSSLP
jgi:hypothetical protein